MAAHTLYPLTLHALMRVSISQQQQQPGQLAAADTISWALIYSREKSLKRWSAKQPSRRPRGYHRISQVCSPWHQQRDEKKLNGRAVCNSYGHTSPLHCTACIYANAPVRKLAAFYPSRFFLSQRTRAVSRWQRDRGRIQAWRKDGDISSVAVSCWWSRVGGFSSGDIWEEMIAIVWWLRLMTGPTRYKHHHHFDVWYSRDGIRYRYGALWFVDIIHTTYQV